MNAALAALLVQDAAGASDILARAAALREAVPKDVLARPLSAGHTTNRGGFTFGLFC